MTVRTTAGSTLRICAAQPATYNVAGYAALAWTLVGEITDFGEFGREYTGVTHNPVGSRGTVKMKGSFNEGAMDLQLGLDTDDAGQLICKQAANSDNNYSVEVMTQNGDKYYMQVQVMSFKTQLGGVDDVTAAAITMEITTNSAGVGVVESLV